MSMAQCKLIITWSTLDPSSSTREAKVRLPIFHSNNFSQKQKTTFFKSKKRLNKKSQNQEMNRKDQNQTWMNKLTSP